MIKRIPPFVALDRPIDGELCFSRSITDTGRAVLALLHIADRRYTLPSQAKLLRAAEAAIDPGWSLPRMVDQTMLDVGKEKKFTFFGASFEDANPMSAVWRTLLINGSQPYTTTSFSMIDIGRLKGHTTLSGYTDYVATIARDMARHYSFTPYEEVVTGTGPTSRTSIAATWYAEYFAVLDETSALDTVELFPWVVVPGESSSTLAVSRTRATDEQFRNLIEKGDVAAFKGTIYDEDSNTTFGVLRALTRYALYEALASMASPAAGLFSVEALGITDDAYQRNDVRHKAVSRKAATVAASFSLLPYLALDAYFEMIRKQFWVAECLEKHLESESLSRKFTDATDTLSAFRALPASLAWVPTLAVSGSAKAPALYEASAFKSAPFPRVTKGMPTFFTETSTGTRRLEALYNMRAVGTLPGQLFWENLFKERESLAARKSIYSSGQSLQSFFSVLLENRFRLHNLLRGSSASSPGANLLGYTLASIGRACNWKTASDSARNESLFEAKLNHTDGVEATKAATTLIDFVESYDVSVGRASGAPVVLRASRSKSAKSEIPALDSLVPHEIDLKGLRERVGFAVPTRKGLILQDMVGKLINPGEYVLRGSSNNAEGIEYLGSDYRAFENTLDNWAMVLGLPQPQQLTAHVANNPWLWEAFFTFDITRNVAGVVIVTNVKPKPGYVATSSKLREKGRCAQLALSNYAADEAIVIKELSPIAATAIAQLADVGNPTSFLRDGEEPVMLDSVPQVMSNITDSLTSVSRDV